jgi:hypothetical protein
MTHKSPRNLHICNGCVCGFHHVGKLHATEQGLPCNCVCQEQDFSMFCAQTPNVQLDPALAIFPDPKLPCPTATR